MMGAETDISMASDRAETRGLTSCDEQQDPSDEDEKVGKGVGESAHYSQLQQWVVGYSD